MTEVGIIGAGHVGLVQALSFFRNHGEKVVVVDTDVSRIKNLRLGIAPFVEAGVDELLKQALAKGAIRFETWETLPVEVVSEVRFWAICVPTPPASALGVACGVAESPLDNAFVDAAATSLQQAMISSGESDAVVAVMSTVMPGTTRRLAGFFRGLAAVIRAPEFLAEGTALEDVGERVVVGVVDSDTKLLRIDLTRWLGGQPMMVSAEAAEVAKLASNYMLATRLSAINAVAQICETQGADVADVVDIISEDRRIGNRYLTPGIGWGGSCFPKDVAAVAHLLTRTPYRTSSLQVSIENREAQVWGAGWMITALRRAAEGLDNPTLRVIWVGTAFKPGTSDTRHSPGLAILERFLSQLGVAWKGVPRVDVVTDDSDGRCVKSDVDGVWVNVRLMDRTPIALALDSQALAAGVICIVLGHSSVFDLYSDVVIEALRGRNVVVLDPFSATIPFTAKTLGTPELPARIVRFGAGAHVPRNNREAL